MEKCKTFNYGSSNEQKTLSFDLNDNGFINSKKYSLLEVMADTRLHCLAIDKRVEILNSFIEDLKSQNHFLYRREMASGCASLVKVKDPCLGGDKTMINLASNDYLNLSQHPRVKNAVVKAVMKYGLGAGASPMLTGTTSLHKTLENELAAFLECEASMLFASGYAANIGTILALLSDQDAAICDMYAHASLMDGCTNTNKFYFKHNDIQSLALTLQKACAHQNKLVIIDGVYSMDGDIARLDEIIEVAHKYGAWVLLDEAHATGIIGKDGRGTASYFGLEGKADITTGTFSKALGAVGGFVAGKKDLINYLQAACRSYVFATAPAIPVVAGAIEAIRIIQQESVLRQNLFCNINYFKSCLEDMGFNLGTTETAIIPIIIGNDHKVKEMTYRLHQAGILVNAVVYPAAPKKLTRVRITLTAALTRKQMNAALYEIERIGKDLGIIAGSKVLAVVSGSDVLMRTG